MSSNCKSLAVREKFQNIEKDTIRFPGGVIFPDGTVKCTSVLLRDTCSPGRETTAPRRLVVKPILQDVLLLELMYTNHLAHRRLPVNGRFAWFSRWPCERQINTSNLHMRRLKLTSANEINRRTQDSNSHLFWLLFHNLTIAPYDLLMWSCLPF